MSCVKVLCWLRFSSRRWHRDCSVLRAKMLRLIASAGMSCADNTDRGAS